MAIITDLSVYLQSKCFYSFRFVCFKVSVVFQAAYTDVDAKTTFQEQMTLFSLPMVPGVSFVLCVVAYMTDLSGRISVSYYKQYIYRLFFCFLIAF